MKNLKYIIFILVLVLVGLIALKSRQRPPLPPTDGIDLSSDIVAEQLCYIWNTEAGDRAMLSIDIREKNLIGEFYFLPAEKDQKTGIFKGTIAPVGINISNRKISAIWETSAEGMTVKEELYILLEGNIAKPGFGEMKDNGNGIYIYANPNDISYPINLQKTDCGDEAMD